MYLDIASIVFDAALAFSTLISAPEPISIPQILPSWTIGATMIVLGSDSGPAAIEMVLECA